MRALHSPANAKVADSQAAPIGRLRIRLILILGTAAVLLSASPAVAQEPAKCHPKQRSWFARSRGGPSD